MNAFVSTRIIEPNSAKCKSNATLDVSTQASNLPNDTAIRLVVDSAVCFFFVSFRSYAFSSTKTRSFVRSTWWHRNINIALSRTRTYSLNCILNRVLMGVCGIDNIVDTHQKKNNNTWIENRVAAARFGLLCVANATDAFHYKAIFLVIFPNRNFSFFLRYASLIESWSWLSSTKYTHTHKHIS